jgi:hypothetical protein
VEGAGGEDGDANGSGAAVAAGLGVAEAPAHHRAIELDAEAVECRGGDEELDGDLDARAIGAAGGRDGGGDEFADGGATYPGGVVDGFVELADLGGRPKGRRRRGGGRRGRMNVKAGWC